MFFYLAIAIIVAICTEISIKSKTKVLKYLFFIITLSLPSFLFAVRYGIGTDYYNYVSIFENAKNNLDSRIEWGYYSLNSVVAQLGGKAELAFFVTAITMFLFVYLALKKHSDIISPGVGMFVFMLFYYQMSFNAVRQVIAMTIILLSMKYIKDRKFLVFSILVIIASGFHISALIFFPMYFLYKIIGKQKRIISRLFLYIVILIMIFSLDKVLTPVLSMFADFEYYIKYLEDRNTSADIGFIVRSLPFIILGLYLYKYKDNSNEDLTYYYSIYIIGILLKFTTFVGAEFIGRLSLVFEVVLVLLIPYYVRLFNRKGEVYISWLLLCYVVIHWWYVFIFIGSHETYPYEWIFD